MTTKKGKRDRRRASRVSHQSIAPDSALLTYREAARFLGISQGTLENWISSGLYRVPHLRLGRLIRFRLSSLTQWLASREENVEKLAVRVETHPAESASP